MIFSSLNNSLPWQQIQLRKEEEESLICEALFTPSESECESGIGSNGSNSSDRVNVIFAFAFFRCEQDLRPIYTERNLKQKRKDQRTEKIKLKMINIKENVHFRFHFRFRSVWTDP